MSGRIEELADWLHHQLANGGHDDILSVESDLSIDDAYRVQFSLMQRYVSGGDRILGYKAAYTSKEMQQRFGISEPVIGTLLASNYFQEEEVIPIRAQDKNLAEPEIAFVLKNEVRGPGLCVHSLLNAIDRVIAAIEIGVVPNYPNGRSRQMGVAEHKVTGGYVLGKTSFSVSEIDLRHESALISRNGQPLISGTGFNVLGNPLNAAVAIVNTVGRYGREIRAGSVLMTGSQTAGLPVFPGDDVKVEYVHLGCLDVRL